MQIHSLWILLFAILISVSSYNASQTPNNKLKTSIFLSPPFFQGPGSVVNHLYYDVKFPKGHIAIKSFNAEVVDENGNPIPLHETYLHHWLVEKYYIDKSNSKNFVLGRNSGVCNNTLGQNFGLGSETRKTLTWVPDPYGIVAGDPKEVPNGYEEKWLMNIHAIDTRGVKDRVGCTECKCSLYNVSKDDGLSDGYIGGLHCCHDKMQCELRDGVDGGDVRKRYLRYTVKWMEWDEAIVPVKIYIFDITESQKRCKVEYQVDPCGEEGISNGRCIDTKITKSILPRGGDLIYGVSHQHSGGLGAALYGQDGRLICSSFPTYGSGTEPGNEEGYIVGMSTCYPKPGSIKISDGEILTHVSNYSRSQLHTGVMGLFYLLIAEETPQEPKYTIFQQLAMPWRFDAMENWWGYVLVCGIVVMIIYAINYNKRNIEGYQAL